MLPFRADPEHSVNEGSLCQTVARNDHLNKMPRRGAIHSGWMQALKAVKLGSCDPKYDRSIFSQEGGRFQHQLILLEDTAIGFRLSHASFAVQVLGRSVRLSNT